MRIVFRADASVQIGSGHVMRCMTLADELRRRGAEIRFICRAHAGNLIALLTQRDYPVVIVAPGRESADAPPEPAAWLGASSAEDALATRAALADWRPDWLVVDHYALAAPWESALKDAVGRIMVIDDLADRPHDADLLLDQNHYADAEDRYRGLVAAQCRLLLGPHYALLRPQFAAARESRRWRDGEVRHLLICFGGADADNLTARAIDAFLAARQAAVTAEVVIGGANPHWPELASRYGALQNVRLHREVSDMAALMKQADLFLGAGGSMTWERSAVALPGLTIAVAANQQRLCEDLEVIGGGLHLGDPATASAASIAAALRLLVRHPHLLRAFGARLGALTDGRGATRVARLLASSAIQLRQAVEDDCDRLHAWRNAPETRRHSGDGKPIPLEHHRAWFVATLNNPRRILLVGEQPSRSGDPDPVGVLRYDLDADSATISVYLVPGKIGAGQGRALIEAGDAWLGKHYPDIARVHARIDPGNLASIGAFSAAGYVAAANLFLKTL